VKLILSGREYELEDALQRSTLADLYQLKLKTGIGMKTLKASLEAMGEFDNPEDFLDDERVLLAFNALIWLCRRRAGEKLTLEEANDVPISEVAFETDEPDVTPDEPADPTPARTDSVPGVSVDLPPTTD
jgi:hypothetical protein